jgi:hypothetical protein
MKISVDDQEVFVLSETQKKVIQNDIPAPIFVEDMKRRLQWVLNHKYERCLERLKAEWVPKLKTRMSSIPVNDEALAEIICSQPDYKCRATKDVEMRK